MEYKALVTGKSRSTILNSCEYGEEVAISTYEDVLSNHADDLTAQQQSMLNAQCASIKADHDRVKSLQEMAAA